MTRYLFTLLFIVFGLCTPVAAVSPSLSLSPAKYDLKTIEGQIQESTIIITNNSDVAIPIKTEVMDFAPKDNKGKVAYNVSLPGRSAKSWFHLKNAEFLLDPHESHTVEVAITPPETIPPGSYFSVVMFEASLPSNYFDGQDQTQAKIIPWIGTLYLLKVGEIPPLDESSLTIKQFSYPKFWNKKEIPVVLEVANNTNFHISPEADFKLASYFGTLVAHTKTEETTIMPGMTRLFEATISQNQPFGLYRGQAEIKVADYHKTISGGPLYILTVLGMGLILTGLLGVGHGVLERHHYKHRVRSAWRALTHRNL